MTTSRHSSDIKTKLLIVCDVTAKPQETCSIIQKNMAASQFIIVNGLEAQNVLQDLLWFYHLPLPPSLLSFVPFLQYRHNFTLPMSQKHAGNLQKSSWYFQLCKLGCCSFCRAFRLYTYNLKYCKATYFNNIHVFTIFSQYSL